MYGLTDFRGTSDNRKDTHLTFRNCIASNSNKQGADGPIVANLNTPGYSAAARHRQP